MPRSVPDRLTPIDRPTGIDPVELARVRAQVTAHLQLTGSLDTLDIDRFAPAPGTKFAFVHPTPRMLTASKVPDRSLWRRCSYCQTNYKFIDGRIVLCEDHKMRLIGRCCWREHIAEQDWNAANVEFKRYQRVERFKIMKERYVPVGRRLQAEIRTAMENASPTISFAEGFWSTFRQRFPDLALELEKAHRHDDRLIVERYRMSYETFEGRRGQAEADKIGGNIGGRLIPEALHRMTGSGAIDIRPHSVHAAIHHAFRQINEASRVAGLAWADMSDKHFDATATEFETACRSAADAAFEALVAMRAVAVFMARPNMSGIAKWANDNDCEVWMTAESGRFEALADGLAFVGKNGARIEFRMPANYSIPAMPSLARMRELLLNEGIGKQKAA